MPVGKSYDFRRTNKLRKPPLKYLENVDGFFKSHQDLIAIGTKTSKIKTSTTQILFKGLINNN